MKLVFILFIMISFSSIAGKTYDLTCYALSLVNEEPIVGMVIELTDGERVLEVQVTDIDGKVVFRGLNSKSISIHGKDNLADYCGFNSYINNKEKVNTTKYHYIRYKKDKEIALFDQQEKRYQNEEGGFLDFLSNDPDKKNCDSKNVSEASYTGGAAAMQKFIAMNVHYPQESIERNEQGRIYLKFIIERNGEISHVVVEKGISPALDLEAKMLVYNMTKWEPSKCGDVPMRTMIRLPITFALN